jgi:hypothetical protein
VAYVTFDMSQVDALADDLGKVPDVLRPRAEQVVKRAAIEVKRLWKANVREASPRGAERRLFGDAIDFDVMSSGDEFSASIGPVIGRPQGELGRGDEYGSINQNTPHMSGHRAADTEEPLFVDWVERVGYEALRDGLAG